MKTVMKKMFCLLLVAVMLVSAVPVAFANEGGEGGETPEPCKHENHHKHNGGSNLAPTCTTPGYECHKCDDCTDYYFSYPLDIDPDAHAWDSGVETKAATCTTPGVRTFTCGNGCGTPRTEDIAVDPDAHTYEGGKCKHCGKCLGCGRTGDNCICCDVCGATNGGHNDDCTVGCNKQPNCESQWSYDHKEGCESQNVCETCGETGHFAKNCPDTICPDCGAAVANGKHEPGCIELCNNKRNCPNETVTAGHHNTDCEYALCNTAKCTKNDGHSGEHTGAPCTDEHCDYALDHAGKHSYLCPESGCELPVNHSGKHSNEFTHENGSSKVKVYVNLYTGDVKTATKQLVVYNEAPSVRIYESIAEHQDMIRAELEDQYPGYTWPDKIYDSENIDAQSMNSKVGDGITVHINAYSSECMVYLYVHNARTYDRLGIVRLHGKKVGETVTESEVRKAVKDYYSFSHLSMYDTEKWDDYVDGKTVTPDGTLTVGSSHYVIDVKISGSVKSSSSYTADSTNPKTGDEIFVPMAVLGLSASALAIMFYLNKKRAY